MQLSAIFKTLTPITTFNLLFNIIMTLYTIVIISLLPQCLAIRCYICSTNYYGIHNVKNPPDCATPKIENCSGIVDMRRWHCLTYAGVVNKTTTFQIKDCYSPGSRAAIDRIPCHLRQNHLKGFHCNICQRDLCNGGNLKISDILILALIIAGLGLVY